MPSLRFLCCICQQPINQGNVIFVCRGEADEPVPDAHKRLRAMHEECAKKVGLVIWDPSGERLSVEYHSALTIEQPLYVHEGEK